MALLLTQWGHNPFSVMTIIGHLLHQEPTMVGVQFQAAQGQTLCSVFLKDAVNPTEFFPNKLVSKFIDATELEQVQVYCDAFDIKTHVVEPHIM